MRTGPARGTRMAEVQSGWVGRSIPQVDIEAKLRGETAYIADVSLPNMAHAAIVRSPVPHGIIRGIDTSRAERVPGVLAVATAADVLPVLIAEGPQRAMHRLHSKPADGD